MKVLFCTTVCDHAITGAGRFAQTIRNWQDEMPGIDLTIVSEDVEHQPAMGMIKVPLPSGKSMGYRRKCRLYRDVLVTTLADRSIDALLFGNAWLSYYWLKEDRGIPAVAAIRDDNAIHVFENRHAAIPGMLARRSMERASTRKLARIICNSQYLADKVSSSYGTGLARITVIPPAYTTYDTRSWTINHVSSTEPVRVLFAKHDYRRGGLRLLVKGLSEMNDRNFILTIAGPRPKEIKQVFAREIKRYKHVEWNLLGRIYRREDMDEVMAQQHIYCTPASRETFGVGNLEALNRGLRVVYRPLGGVPRTLQNYAFPVNDDGPGTLRGAIEEAICIDMSELEQRVRAGRQWIHSTFGPGKMLSQVYQVLEQAIASPQNQSRGQR